ncbi:hypothetical protein ACFYO0_44850 [Streptomyces sp. NPDC006365]|uniref:hypothetical protein n=1 Tax=Streptomyces sp. NPDC006365 TaxID=3364744 RepID=UPI00369BFCA1
MPCPGGPRTVTDEQVAAVVKRTLESTRKNARHWSMRTVARGLGLWQSTVSRIWRAFGLQPHRTGMFKLSMDLYFIDRVRDVVGLCLDPPERAPSMWRWPCPPCTIGATRSRGCARCAGWPAAWWC